ncbi:choice-of-anchor L domain-containing protein [Psychroserpens sp. AS72]|uniref:choice-of-anchor L domain-containing protein n=1 Tax=Psychroserpens sp. AS72 TaxID=3135775 RepID=UPI003176C98D
MKRTLLIPCLLVFNIMWSQMTVTPNSDAEDLILNNLIGNPNFPSSNYISVTGNSFGDVNGLGTFNYVGSDFDFAQGLVLSTGDVIDVPGPNTMNSSSGSSNWFGDPDLDFLFNNTQTYNASLLQFDFTAEVEMISLDFLMASEEYDGSAFECNFADSFAFILTNNNTGVSQNLALVPGTSTPIAVTTVHYEVQGSCVAINEAYFERYNFENTNSSAPSIPTADSPINANGQTKVFVLMGDLDIGSSYTIKIAIADASDSAFDSVLFVRNSSFGAFPIIDDEPEDLVVEDTDENGFETFDLTLNEALMLGAVDTATYSFLFSYYLTQADAEAGINAISNPEAYTNMSNVQNIYVSMRNAYTGKQVISDFRIAIHPNLLSLEDLERSEIALYPNPVIDQLFIDTNASQIENVEVYAMNGQLLLSQFTIEDERISVDFSNLSNGLYLVKLTSQNGSVYKRILK